MPPDAPHLAAAKALRRTIPPPTPAKAKATKSWRLLKPGQLLQAKDKIVVGDTVLPPGSLWAVHTVNSLGALLRLQDDDPERQTFLSWSRPEWKDHFTRARARRKGPKKKASQ